MIRPSLIKGLRSQTISLYDYLAQLEDAFARIEPQVLAFLPEEGRFDRLRREASELLRRYPNLETRPPLFGVPVGVKDIYNVDGFSTRAGTDLPPALFAKPEAPCVTALKNAGALILGKTVTTQFAYFAPGHTRHPLSAALGEVRTPGGSSSGSAAAVAAGLAPLALGTQTIGSIIRPAAFCGVVGFKPTFGRVSTTGIVPLAPSADTVGWFAATVDGVARAAAIIVPDWQDTKYEIRDTSQKGTSLALGVPEGPYLERASSAALDHFHDVCDRLAGAGYRIISVPVMANFEDIYRRHNDLVAFEAARTHAVWFGAFRDAYHPKTVELIRHGRTVLNAAYQHALDARQQLRDELHELMSAHGINLWIAPAAVGPALPGLESTGDPVMALPWTHAGLPALSLPAGTDATGWPLGLQAMGRYGEDEALLAAATPIETTLR
jgi:Asp-tRNA(Asn)/Glu-tRNA(Gln) amidotransferase A subunit family amidase